MKFTIHKWVLTRRPGAAIPCDPAYSPVVPLLGLLGKCDWADVWTVDARLTGRDGQKAD